MTKDGQDKHDEQESALSDEYDPEPEAGDSKKQLHQEQKQVEEEEVDQESALLGKQPVEQNENGAFSQEAMQERLAVQPLEENGEDGQAESKEEARGEFGVRQIEAVSKKQDSDQETLESGKETEKVGGEKPREDEEEGLASKLIDNLDDGDDPDVGNVNANVEMPAITKESAQPSDETELLADRLAAMRHEKATDDAGQETKPIVDPEKQEVAQTPPASVPKEEGLVGQVPEKKLEASPIVSVQPIAEENKQNGRKRTEDPYEVQKVLDDLPFWRDESQHLRASYSSTTAYRVAIKKRRYTSVGNTIFLICSGLLIIVGIIVFLPYFVRSLAGTRTATPTGTVQVTPSPNKSGVSTNLVGAETAAPRANGVVLAGYQWIQDSTKHNLYIDANNHIQELASNDGQTWQITDLTRRSGAALANGRALAGFAWQRGNSAQVVYIDAKQHVQQLYSSGNGQWDVLDLTRKAQAPLANGAVITGYEWTQNGSKQVDYIDQRGHIQELASSDGSNWTISDLTALTGAPQANGNVLTSYQWNRLGSKHVDYIDLNQHVQELSFSGGSWHRSDLNALVGAPPANGKTLTSYQWRQSGSRQIAYLDTSNHVQLLSSTSASNWSLVDLTHLLNAPVANGNALTGCEWQQGGRIVLYFLDGNDHLQEISDAPGENWQLADLNQFMQGAPLVDGKVLVSYDWAQHGSKQVVYIDSTNSVHELTSSNIPGRWELSNWKQR